jgi:cell division protein DivIC
MKNPKLAKFVLCLVLGVFVAAGIGLTVLFRQTYREYANATSREAEFRQRLTEAETKLKEKEDSLHRLRHDPAYIERAIRQRLGYVRPGELLFRFEETEEPVK